MKNNKVNSKELVLNLLGKSCGQYISGEQIGKELGISRASIWKAIKSLQKEGYEIDGVSNKGYRLQSGFDIMTKEGIEKELKTFKDVLDINFFEQIDSTNTYLKMRTSNESLKQGVVAVAKEQTAGRGRTTKTFFSPKDSGVYISIFLTPKIKPYDSWKITTVAGIAVCNTIEKWCGKQSAIKWVNDVFMQGKKVCGILTEGSLSMESGGMEYVILGVGINAYKPAGHIPESISNIMGWISKEKIESGRNKLVATFLEEFMTLYSSLDTLDIISLYKAKSLVLGKKIFVIKGTEQIEATAVDIDQTCSLIVKYNDGSLQTLNSGEISIKVGE